MNTSVIELKDIRKEYITGEHSELVLNELSFSFDYGSNIAVLGSSGCGKTTLINIIGGIDTDYQGDLIYNGDLVTDLDKYRREHISFIFQDLNLVKHLDLVSNITIGLTNDVHDKKKKAEELLKKVGLEDHIHKKPHQLSGGEKQRVAIARALARDTDVLLCDEPTGSLDEKTKKEIMELILEVFEDKTVIFITHDVELANNYADLILGFENKKLITIKKRVVNNKVKKSFKESTHNKSFDRRFIPNLLSNKLSLFNATYLIILISAIFLLGIGVVRGVEDEIDNYLVNKHETRTIHVGGAKMSYTGFTNNIEDYNEEFRNPIVGFLTATNTKITLSNDQSYRAIYVSMQESLSEVFNKDIVDGRFPENNNEVLFSKGMTIQTLYDYYSIGIEDYEEKLEVFEFVTSLEDEELLDELLMVEIIFLNSPQYNDNRVFDPNFKIVGIIDDFDFQYTGDIELLPERYYDYFQKSDDSANTYLRLRNGEEVHEEVINNNIYIYEEVYLDYLKTMFITVDAQKFYWTKLVIPYEDLDYNEEVFDNFLLFKPIFSGQNTIVEEREFYHSEFLGYKVSILAGCAILALFALASVFNGIKSNIDRHKSDIGIYKSLGYSDKQVRRMFLVEGIFLTAYIFISTIVIWYILNLVLNESMIDAFDPNRIIEKQQIIYLDITSLIGIALAILGVVIYSISNELTKIDIIKLIRNK